MTRNTNGQLTAKVFKLRPQLNKNDNSAQFTVTQLDFKTLQITFWISIQLKMWKLTQSDGCVCKETRTRFMPSFQGHTSHQTKRTNQRESISEAKIEKRRCCPLLNAAAGPVLIQHWHSRTGYLQSKLDKHSALNRFRLHWIIRNLHI
jgi:hypothetical protein